MLSRWPTTTWNNGMRRTGAGRSRAGHPHLLQQQRHGLLPGPNRHPPAVVHQTGTTNKRPGAFNANANGAKAGDCRCNVGTSQGGGGFKGSDNLPNSIATLTIAERSNASFTEGIVDEYTFTVTDCAATTCLSWQYAKKSSTAWISGYTSMWMDNIRVTIAH